MRSKEDIILDMCFSFRDDFGLNKTTSSNLNIGISKEEKEELYKKMKEIFEECIEPYMEMKKPENYLVLQNGFSPTKGDLDINEHPIKT